MKLKFFQNTGTEKTLGIYKYFHFLFVVDPHSKQNIYYNIFLTKIRNRYRKQFPGGTKDLEGIWLCVRGLILVIIPLPKGRQFFKDN